VRDDTMIRFTKKLKPVEQHLQCTINVNSSTLI
jgi:hypothetical protein